jgi:hypothetical protein
LRINGVFFLIVFFDSPQSIYQFAMHIIVFLFCIFLNSFKLQS